MTPDVALILAVDGLANGSVYLLAGLGLVLIFSVTRVVFVPFGDLAAYAAMSVAAFESGRRPPTIALVASLIVVVTIVEVIGCVRRRETARIPRALLAWTVAPALPCLVALAASGRTIPHALQIAVAIALVVPIGPLVARLALRPIADASMLVLLIASIALHYLMSGLGLLFFGPEGTRTAALADGTVSLGADVTVTGQVLLMWTAAIVLSALFFVVFERTVVGRALRATAVNRVGARLVGIRPARTATLAYALASLLAGFVGAMVAPVTTLYYDSGFLLSLKAFVAAIIGGLVSYPLTAIGALAVGMVESFGSFWSGALKDVIVFGLLIPVLLARSALARHADDDGEEIDR